MADLAVHQAPAAEPPPTDTARSTPPVGRRGLPAAAVRAWSRLLARPSWQQVLVAYAASRVVAAVIIEASARLLQNPAGVGDLHPDYWDMVVIWDGQWYRQIVERGYPDGLPLTALGQVDYNSWAFFPLFPTLVRWLTLTGLPFSAAASLLNLTLGAGAAVVLWHLFVARAPGAHVGRARSRLGVLAVATWCLLPPAAVLQMAYTEALAALLLASVLLLVVRRRNLWAVPVVVLLGLTRAVAAPLLVVLAWHVAARWRSPEPVGRREWRAMGVLVAATAVSTLLWPAIVGVATGVPTAFFQSQAVWGQSPGTGPFVPWFAWAWDHLGVVGVLLLVGAVAALCSVVAGRHAAWLSGELRVWAVAYPLYLLAVLRPITSMWRFLLLDLPIAAVLASVAVRGTRLGRPGSPRWRWRVAAVLVGAVAAMGWWVGVLLTRIPWNGSPP